MVAVQLRSEKSTNIEIAPLIANTSNKLLHFCAPNFCDLYEVNICSFFRFYLHKYYSIYVLFNIVTREK